MGSVIQLVARQIYFLQQSIRLTGTGGSTTRLEGFILPTGDFYQDVGGLREYRDMGSRKASVEFLTGPFAFTNAMVQEMWEEEDKLSELVKVEKGVWDAGFKYINFNKEDDYGGHKKKFRYDLGSPKGLVRA